MSSETIKHLEFIQDVITRMNKNSFMIKGWTVTIVAALLAIFKSSAVATNVDASSWISLIVIGIFWMLDSFFLKFERQYRELYNAIIREEDIPLFSMDISGYEISYFKCFLSKTFVPFYGTLSFVALITSCI